VIRSIYLSVKSIILKFFSKKVVVTRYKNMQQLFFAKKELPGF